MRNNCFVQFENIQTKYIYFKKKRELIISRGNEIGKKRLRNDEKRIRVLKTFSWLIVKDSSKKKKSLEGPNKYRLLASA